MYNARALKRSLKSFTKWLIIAVNFFVLNDVLLLTTPLVMQAKKNVGGPGARRARGP